MTIFYDLPFPILHCQITRIFCMCFIQNAKFNNRLSCIHVFAPIHIHLLKSHSCNLKDFAFIQYFIYPSQLNTSPSQTLTKKTNSVNLRHENHISTLSMYPSIIHSYQTFVYSVRFHLSKSTKKIIYPFLFHLHIFILYLQFPN